jgi:hypothetical protein
MLDSSGLGLLPLIARLVKIPFGVCRKLEPAWERTVESLKTDRRNLTETGSIVFVCPGFYQLQSWKDPDLNRLGPKQAGK